MALTLLTVLWPGTPALEASRFLFSPSAAALLLFATTMTLLLLPKLLSCFALIADAPRRRACGGGLRVLLSTLIETIVSILVAPIMMAFHTMFVITTLLGHRVQWNAQERDENGQGIRDAIAVHWKQTALAILAGAALWWFAPSLLIWTAPILVGLVLAVPLSVILSSAALGRALAQWGLLQIPEEASAPEVLRRHQHFLALPPPKEVAEPQMLFRKLLTDPAYLALHCCVLEATDSCLSAPADAVADAKRQLLAGGPQRVSKENRKVLLSDPAALDDVHLFVWTTQTSASSSSEVERVQGAYTP
jgi:membrane glycosyltransferase